MIDNNNVQNGRRQTNVAQAQFDAISEGLSEDVSPERRNVLRNAGHDSVMSINSINLIEANEPQMEPKSHKNMFDTKKASIFSDHVVPKVQSA